jgi:tetratricopeptide (TPR) repeat protein
MRDNEMIVESSNSKQDLESSKGMLLLEMGNKDAALKIFESLLKDYPEHLDAQVGQILSGVNKGNKSELISKIDNLISKELEDHRIYRLKGFFLLQLDQKSEALTVFQKAYDLVTDIKYKKQYEFYITLIMDGHLGALVKYNELLDMNAASDDVRWVAMLCMLQEDDIDSLKTTADFLIAEHPHEKSIYLFRGIAKCFQGDFLGGREDILISLERINDRLPVEVKADVNFLIGHCEFQLKNYSQAIYRFSEAIRSDQTRGEAYYERGRAKLLNGEPENAIQDFNKSLALNYSDEDCYVTLGNVYLLLYQIDNAIIQFNKLLASAPMDLDGHYGLGRCSMVKMNNTEARREFELCLQIDKSYSGAWENLAILDLIENQKESAINNAHKAEEFGEEFGRVELIKGWAAFIDCQYSECVRWCDIAIKKDSKLVAAYTWRGFAKLCMHDENGISDFKTSNILNVGNPVRDINGAIAALADKKYDEAERMLTEILDSHKTYSKKTDAFEKQIKFLTPAIFYYRTIVRVEQKKFRQALKDINIVLEHDQKEVNALCLKAAIQIGLKDYKDAGEAINIILEINPQYAPAYI